ncbi:MAG TPA: DUF354 domain-containing protein [Methanoregula sp.]|nr:DUF354 domain-containing protein [Methanoregula sp.]
MKILIDMGHPAHVHLFKNFIWEMQKQGHEIKVTARDKEVTRQLLDAYHIPYQLIGKPLPGKFGLMREWVSRGYKIHQTGKKFNADLYLGILNPATAISAKLAKKTSFTFTDTEHAAFAKRVTFPFTTKIITPSCYMDEVGPKQVRYNGYHELAYLHPNYFTPNPAVLDEVGLTKDEPFIILRFVSWGASHDKNQYGIQDKESFVRAIEKYGRVFITSEMDLPENLKSYVLKLAPEKLHDLLAYASLYIGEGATTASECAVLGTHAIYVNTLRLGYTDEEEKKYGLVFNYSCPEQMHDDILKKIITLLGNKNLKTDGKEKQKKLLADKEDPTAFMVAFVEDYLNCVDEFDNGEIRF